MKEVEQLEALYPQTRQVTLASVKGDGARAVIEVSPVRIGQLAPFMRAINSLLPAFEDEGDLDLGELVIRHADSVIDGLAVAVNVDRRFVEALDLADAVALFGAVVEVNADFFTHRLRPIIESVAAKIMALPGRSSVNA